MVGGTSQVKVEASIVGGELKEECKISVDGEPYMKMKGERVKMKLSGGVTYDGLIERKTGELTGKAKIHYRDGSVYGGEVIDGRAHGKGKVAYSSGEVWEGELEENEKEGKARMSVEGGEWEGEYIGGQVYEKSSKYSMRI